MYHIRFRLYTFAFVMIICLNLLILIFVCWESKTGLSVNDYIKFMKKKYILEIPKLFNARKMRDITTVPWKSNCLHWWTLVLLKIYYIYALSELHNWPEGSSSLISCLWIVWYGFLRKYITYEIFLFGLIILIECKWWSCIFRSWRRRERRNLSLDT